METAEIKVSNSNALRLGQLEDFTDTEIRLGDFIRLKGLQAGMIFYLKDDGSGQKIIIIGNGTPAEGVSSVSFVGWDWNLYNNWIVERVLLLEPVLSGSFLTPSYVKNVAEIVAGQKREDSAA